MIDTQHITPSICAPNYESEQTRTQNYIGCGMHLLHKSLSVSLSPVNSQRTDYDYLIVFCHFEIMWHKGSNLGWITFKFSTWVHTVDQSCQISFCANKQQQQQQSPPTLPKSFSPVQLIIIVKILHNVPLTAKSRWCCPQKCTDLWAVHYNRCVNMCPTVCKSVSTWSGSLFFFSYALTELI